MQHKDIMLKMCLLYGLSKFSWVFSFLWPPVARFVLSVLSKAFCRSYSFISRPLGADLWRVLMPTSDYDGVCDSDLALLATSQGNGFRHRQKACLL